MGAGAILSQNGVFVNRKGGARRIALSPSICASHLLIHRAPIEGARWIPGCVAAAHVACRDVARRTKNWRTGKSISPCIPRYLVSAPKAKGTLGCATLHSRGARKLLALPLTSKLDALCGSKPNRFPCAWRKKTRSVARAARPKAKGTPNWVSLLLSARVEKKMPTI